VAESKLEPDAQRLVVERVIAGDTNNEIRRRLQDAGYPYDLTDPAFSYYRQAEEVKEAIARKDAEAVQSGYAQRSERILKLAKSAKRFERRLAENNEADEFVPGSVGELVALHREYVNTLDALGKLVDPNKPQAIDVRNVNFADLSAEQLERIANGEPIGSVLSSAGAGRN